PVGEEQELDDIPHRLGTGPPRIGGRGCGVVQAGHIYVSHVDIFWFYCYPKAQLRERIVPAGHSLAVVIEPVPEARSDWFGPTYRDSGRDAKAARGQARTKNARV